MVWYDATDKEGFKIYGLCADYKRIPPEVSRNISGAVASLSDHSAGGRICFSTDSRAVSVKVKLIGGGMMNHMPLSGMSGVDFYINGTYRATIRPDSASQTEYTGGVAGLPFAGYSKVELYLPLYNGISEVLIGVDDDASVALTPKNYRVNQPVVFYGSSITQGGCASKPSNAYTALVSRWLSCDHINLGFSGAAKGERAMAQYIASLEMSAFVMDYDHNAPDVKCLSDTHEEFFTVVRRAQPDLPVVFMSKPDFDLNPTENAARRTVIETTYMNARKNGDGNVYFIDGESLFGDDDRGICTVDTCHPNDIGFYRMARTVKRVLAKII